MPSNEARMKECGRNICTLCPVSKFLPQKARQLTEQPDIETQLVTYIHKLLTRIKNKMVNKIILFHMWLMERKRAHMLDWKRNSVFEITLKSVCSGC